MGLLYQAGHIVTPSELVINMHLKLETTSTATPPTSRGGGMLPPFLQSTIISFIFFALMQRLLVLHQTSIHSTSCLYFDSSFLEIRPTTTVSSANLTIRALKCMAIVSQSSVQQGAQDTALGGTTIKNNGGR